MKANVVSTLKSLTIVLAPGLILTAIFFTNVIKANVDRSPAVVEKVELSLKQNVENYLNSVK